MSSIYETLTVMPSLLDAIGSEALYKNINFYMN